MGTNGVIIPNNGLIIAYNGAVTPNSGLIIANNGE